MLSMRLACVIVTPPSQSFAPLEVEEDDVVELLVLDEDAPEEEDDDEEVEEEDVLEDAVVEDALPPVAPRRVPSSRPRICWQHMMLPARTMAWSGGRRRAWRERLAIGDSCPACLHAETLLVVGLRRS
jgi:hypothetical protein